MQRWPSLKQLQYLVALDEHKNFNRAAKACHVSQSTLSTGIQTLEDMMNLHGFGPEENQKRLWLDG
jgi:LysR family hydrogen peroxide-inducible transcriptional activator